MSLIPSISTTQRSPGVAIQSSQSARTEELLGMIVQDAIAADACIHHADRRCVGPRSQTFRQSIGPAVVGVDLRMVAIGDGVAERDERAGLAGRFNIDFID